MGQVIIEIPQNVNRSYRVDDSEFGEKFYRIWKTSSKK